MQLDLNELNEMINLCIESCNAIVYNDTCTLQCIGKSETASATDRKICVAVTVIATAAAANNNNNNVTNS